MTKRETYVVQTFTRKSSGMLALGPLIPCKDADEARSVAEARVESRRAAGAAAFYRTVAGEFDEGEAFAFATYGSVPRGVADALPF